MDKICYLSDAEAMMAFGNTLLNEFPTDTTVFLQGDLGAGKTTLVRAALHGAGYRGAVKSPTYTLVETYQVAEVQFAHFDLYRLGDPEELEFMGFREYFHEHSICFIEWPDKGSGMLPEADLVIDLMVHSTGRILKLHTMQPKLMDWLAHNVAMCAIIESNPLK